MDKTPVRNPKVSVSNLKETLAKVLRLVSFLFLICTLRVKGRDDDPRVTTSLGELVGSLVQVNDTDSNRLIDVKQFLAVPFAKPPLGNLRFRKPEAVEAWTEPLQCKDMPNACVQYMAYPFPWAMFPHDPRISEDCLYLNIWVPNDTSPQNKKSVFFFIHGGGFFTGSIRQPIYDGRALAGLGDVIVVTTNYRLGALGFWSNNGIDAPGNVGVWDTLEALKWVNSHIENFGGDKDSITLAGESSGAVIVSLFSKTPYAIGLYKRQIVQSATAMWTLMDDKLAVFQRSGTVSEKVGCANETFKLLDHPNEVVECMRRIDALTLLKEEAKINPGSPSSFLPRWGDELFPRNPRETLLEEGFPFTELFIGNSGNEGICAITSAIPEVFGFFGEKEALIGRETAETYLRSFFPTFKDQDQVIEQYLHVLNEADEPELASRQYILALGDAVGDFIIECPTVYYAAVSSQSGVNVYYYDFQHRPVNSVWADWMGTTHFDEVDFVFGGPFKFPSDYPTEERVLSKIMIEHWTNFVKYGKPKDDWPLYVNKSQILVYIDAKQPSEARGPHMYNCMFFQPYMDSENKIVLPDYSL